MVSFVQNDMREEAALELFKTIDEKINGCFGLNAKKQTETPEVKNYYYNVPPVAGDSKRVLLLLFFDKNLQTGYYSVRLNFAKL